MRPGGAALSRGAQHGLVKLLIVNEQITYLPVGAEAGKKWRSGLAEWETAHIFWINMPAS
ncbi:hypothetical protein JM66_01425 [Aeromonas bestiarum]|nr:hypothetical protein JM66_01425 [Aeromonas bestiarum]